MSAIDWRFRLKLFAQRFWQPTSACLTCMPGSVTNLWSPAHWATALQTGLATGILILVLSFTPAGRLFRNRFANAFVVGVLTVVADAYSHANHYGIPYAEAIVTGVISGILALAGSYLLEDRARRVRAAWSRVFARHRT